MIDAITYALLKGDIGQGTQEAVTEYLDEHLTNPSNPPIDTSLEISGAAADSKTTGDKITQLKEDLSELQDGGYIADAQKIQEKVNAYLDEHPEATTTVQDGSLTYKKLVVGTLGYVTPEMFGAVGDGTTDDTEAWQNAVDFGVNVKATKKQYKCGQINVTKNIEIDCNGADFVCTSQTLFNCHGEIIETLTGEKNYTANSIGYSITNSEYSTYSGFAMLKGTNNFDESRDYYYGGFVCTFKNGTLDDTYPVDVLNETDDITIEIIDPITVKISNLGNVSHNNTVGSSIVIEYGINCAINNVNANNISKYVFINLKRCLNCICTQLNISAELGSVGTNSYVVAFEDSSYCSVQDSYLFNRHWHCITTGANYLCYFNSVLNSTLLSETGHAYSDHANGINTIIRHCKITCCDIGPMGVVEDTVIVSVKTNLKTCYININVPSDKRLSGAYVNDITFLPDPDAQANQCGISIGAAPRISGKTFYVNNIKMSNIRIVGASLGQIYFTFFNSTGGAYYTVGNVEIVNTQGEMYLGVNINNDAVDISDYQLYLSNVKSENTVSGELNQFGNPTMRFNYVRISDSKLRALQGRFEKLILHNVYAKNGVSKTTTLVKEIYGSGIEISFYPNFFLPDDQTYNCAIVQITDINGMSPTKRWFNVANDNAGNKYYQIYKNGVLTTEQIAT